MADDHDPAPEPEPETTPDDRSAPARVARSRYVRSGWGVLFAVGVVAGIVVVSGELAEFDSDPFCEHAVEAASATTVTTAPPVPGGAVPDVETPLEAAERRLALYREFRDLLPYDFEDEVDVIIAREEEVVAALEALPDDATPEEATQVESGVPGGPEAAEALFEIDLYAADACGEQLPQLVD